MIIMQIHFKIFFIITHTHICRTFLRFNLYLQELQSKFIPNTFYNAQNNEAHITSDEYEKSKN